MHDESISQAEIDALVRGIMGGEEPAPAPEAKSQSDFSSLQTPLREFAQHAAHALSELVGVPCEAVPGEIAGTTILSAGAQMPGQFLVGSSVLTSGLSGTIYYLVPSFLGLAMITQLYGGVAPSYMDESALGALAEGLSQMNHAGLARLGDVLGRPVGSAQAEAVAVSGVGEVPGLAPGSQVLSLAVDLTILDTTGRIFVLLPQDAANALVQAIKSRGAGRPAAPAQQPASFPAQSAHVAAAAAPARPAASPAQPAPTQASFQSPNFPDLAPRHRSEEIRNIDLLMDVSLQVTVELGRTRRQIRDVLALGPGSVVELDKLAGEQVDVLVNGKLIAKGEVVVIDENYGVRITDIISPQDRVHSLK